MKKLIIMILGLVLVLNNAIVFAEEKVPHIKITSLDEIGVPSYDADDEYGLKAVYIIEKPIQYRAICYNCGRGSLTLFTVIEEWGPTPIPCWGMDGAGYSDFLYEYKYYNGEKCSVCGLNVRAYWNSVWKVCCNNGDDLGLINTWFTIGSGTNIHSMIDPNNPSKNPFD